MHAAASSFFKGLTFGFGTVATALPQGAAAGWGSYIVGQAARYYFEHGASWGQQGPKRVITQILENTDKQSVLQRLKERDQEEDFAQSIRREVTVTRASDSRLRLHPANRRPRPERTAATAADRRATIQSVRRNDCRSAIVLSIWPRLASSRYENPRSASGL